MYTVAIINGNDQRLIHDFRSARNAQKLASGSIVDAENSISSFTFTLYPNNAGYNLINDYTTRIRVYNTKRARYDFVGRVLKSTQTMTANGLITKTVVCEDRMGYLHDSVQPYSEPRHYSGDDTRSGLEEFIDEVLANHNAQVEEYKRIYRGNVTVNPFDSSDDVTKGLNWQSTYDTLKEKLINSFGGYLVLREVEGVLYLDYLESVGTTRSTKIQVGHNMRSAAREIDPSAIVTRLVPLGAKLTVLDAEGNEVQSEERLTIASINDGLDYIVSEEYEKQYGIRYATQTWDDVTDVNNLFRKGNEWLIANNGLAVSNDIDALDLSTIGLEIDDFQVYDSYPVINHAIGMDDILRIIKKTTNVVEPQSSTIEMGDTIKRLSDAVLDYTAELNRVQNDISATISGEVQKQTTTIYTYVDHSISSIQQDPDKIWAAIEDRATAKSDYEQFSEIVRNILQMEADGTTFLFQTINEAIQQVGDTEASHYAELLTYIRFSEDGIEIGKEGNAITMKLDNDSLDFYNNGTHVAYMSDNTLYITDGRFTRSVRIGNYGFIPEANGSVSFTYLGGDN